MNENELIKSAFKAVKNSYAPYSNYRVGAAILTKSGKIYIGCNIENASYPAGICAERCAICNAVANGENEFEAIAVVNNDGEDYSTPCGICRQVLNEFNPEMIVIVAKKNGQFKKYTLDKLLSNAFGPKNLN